jgi:hypothetical protein
MSQPTHYEKKAARIQHKEHEKKFGNKTGKALTTAEYEYYTVTPELVGTSLNALRVFLFGIETFYKQNRPDRSFYKGLAKRTRNSAHPASSGSS